MIYLFFVVHLDLVATHQSILNSICMADSIRHVQCKLFMITVISADSNAAICM